MSRSVMDITHPSLDDDQVNLRKTYQKGRKKQWSRWTSLLFRSDKHMKTRSDGEKRFAAQHAESKTPRNRSREGLDEAPVSQGCLLYEKLPLELRQEIFAYVLGRDMFRLISVPWKVTTAADIFGNVSMTQAHFHSKPAQSKPPRGIALLQTSRQVYNESVDLLYSTNTFVIHDFTTMTTFAKSIPARHFHAIRSLRICYSPVTSVPYKHPRTAQYDLPTGEGWDEFWEMIAGMKSLRDLDVHLERYHELLPEDPELRAFTEYTTLWPLQRLRGLRSFQLFFAYLHINPSYTHEAVYAPEFRRALFASVRKPRTPIEDARKNDGASA
ncbi:MAG: hypothetical protein Q9191_007498 [Dirinaria sp. TL-2023a]